MAAEERSDGPAPPATSGAAPTPVHPAGSVALGVLAAALVVGVGVFAWFIAGGGSDEPVASTDTGDAEVTDTIVASFPFDAQFVEVDDPVRFSFAVPSDWAVVRGFPEQEEASDVVANPDLAPVVDALLDSSPAMFVAVDPESDPGSPTAVAVYLQPSPATTSPLEWAEQTRAALGAEATDAVIEEVNPDVATLRFRPLSGEGQLMTVQSFHAVDGGMLAFVAVGDDPDIQPIVEAIASGVAS